MRIVPAHVAPTVRPDARLPRAAGAPPAPPQLPGAVADRLAGILARDPGLAEAISAALPAARIASARDVAALAAPDHPPGLDLVG